MLIPYGQVVHSKTNWSWSRQSAVDDKELDKCKDKYSASIVIIYLPAKYSGLPLKHNQFLSQTLTELPTCPKEYPHAAFNICNQINTFWLYSNIFVSNYLQI